MRGKHVKLSRQLLSLNQTDFAAQLGWSSKRQVIKLEKEQATVMRQTELAIECLLRRADLLEEFRNRSSDAY